MMVIMRALFITMVLSSCTVFSMENNKELLVDKPLNDWVTAYAKQGKSFQKAFEAYEKENPCFLNLLGDEFFRFAEIVKRGNCFDHIAFQIRSLADKNRTWKKILDKEYYTKHLLRLIEHEYRGRVSSCGCDRIIICESNYFHEELAAVVLGTPGAILLGRKSIMIPENKERLLDFLFTIVGSCNVSYFEWPDEDLDVTKAALGMGIDPQHSRDDFGYPLVVKAAGVNKIKIVKFLLDKDVDIESTLQHQSESKTIKYTALSMAAEHGYDEMVDLLIKRNANVNAIDGSGRTPLMLAAIKGHIEVIKKLLAANAITWLLDGYDKTALNHVEECLLSKDKEKYQTIVQLLKNVGAQ